MNIVIFGLSVSSAWGNGHATLHRGLLRALHNLGHEVHFFERDTEYYAAHRDAPSLPHAQLHLYSDWNENLPSARRQLARADAAIVTSYCPDGIDVCGLILQQTGLRSIFYDMDTPVTLEKIQRGEAVPYLPQSGLGDFDLVLSYTGGRALDQLRDHLGARCAATLYGWVDPQTHHRTSINPNYSATMSYLGTYAADRHTAFEEMLVEPARRLTNCTFIVAGAMYPDPQKWPFNIRHFAHLAPPEHSAFYSSSPVTLSVTRGAMAAMGFCPSGRLFEAAACGTAVLTDWWEGLETFFQPEDEILIARSTADVLTALQLDPGQLADIGRRAQQRVLDCHTAEIRARKLIALIESPRNEATDTYSVAEPEQSTGGFNSMELASRER